MTSELQSAFDVLGGVEWDKDRYFTRRRMVRKNERWYEEWRSDDSGEWGQFGRVMADHEAHALLLLALEERADDRDINIIQSLIGDYRCYVAHCGPMVLCDISRDEYEWVKVFDEREERQPMFFHSRLAALTDALKGTT